MSSSGDGGIASFETIDVLFYLYNFIALYPHRNKRLEIFTLKEGFHNSSKCLQTCYAIRSSERLHFMKFLSPILSSLFFLVPKLQY